MAVVRWTFFDAVTSSTYTFAINPREGGAPERNKQLVYQNTAAPDGKTLILEGRDEVQKLEFSGVILEQAEYDAFNTWYEKRHQVKVTDDLGRQFWVYLTSFKPKRERAASHPWKHTYTVSATILSWV